MKRCAVVALLVLSFLPLSQVQAQWTVFDTLNSEIPGNFIYDTEVVNTTLFAATEQGIGLFNGFDWETMNSSNSGLPGDNVREILRVGSALWFATDKGIGVFDNNEWTVFDQSNSNIPSDNVRDLIVYEGAIYASTINGLGRFSNDEWSVFNTANSDLPTNNLQALGLHSDGRLVVGTETDGIVLTDLSTWQHMNQSNSNLPSNITLSLTKTDTDVVVGTWGAGFAVLRGSSFEVYSSDNSGLADNGIQSVYADNCGRVWVATRNGGINVLDNGLWRQFSEGNSDFPSRRATLVEYSAGVWYFGSDEGLALYEPQAVIESPGIESDIFCAGDGFELAFRVFGDFGPGNKFVAQLSDKNGSFVTPVDVGSIASGCSGVIDVVIPEETKAGDFYELRIMSTNPVGLLEPSIGPLTLNTLPNVTISGETELCFGDTTQLDAGDYVSYTWSNSSTERTISVFESGTYSVEVVDANGCFGEAEFTVQVRDSLGVMAPEALTLCAGQTTTLSVSVTADIVSAAWSPLEGLDDPFSLEPTLTASSSATYTLVVQDDLGCVAYDTLTVNALPAPNKPIVIQRGDTLVCTSANVVQYMWWKDGVALVNQTDSILINPQDAEYQIAISNESGCVSVSDAFRPIVNSVDEFSAPIRLLNTGTHIEVKGTNQPVNSLKLFSLTGQVVREISDTQRISISTISSGIYFLEISIGSRTVHRNVLINN